MTIQERIIELQEKHGGLNAASRALGVDPGYLSKLGSGEKTNPSDEVLKKLKLKRVISYVEY